MYSLAPPVTDAPISGRKSQVKITQAGRIFESTPHYFTLLYTTFAGALALRAANATAEFCCCVSRPVLTTGRALYRGSQTAADLLILSTAAADEVSPDDDCDKAPQISVGFWGKKIFTISMLCRK